MMGCWIIGLTLIATLIGALRLAHEIAGDISDLTTPPRDPMTQAHTGSTCYGGVNERSREQ